MFYRALSLILLICFTSLSFGLDLETAKELALENNLSLRAQEHAFSSSRWAETQSYTGLLPSASLTWNYTDQEGTYPGFPGSFGPMMIGGRSNSFGLNINQPIFNGGKVLLSARMQTYSRRIAEESLRSTRISTIAQVESKYFTILEASDMVEIAEKSLESARMDLEVAEVRYNTGTLSKADYLRMQSQAATREVELIEAQSYLDIALLDFANFLQLETKTELESIAFDQYESRIEALRVVDVKNLPTLIEQLANIGMENNPALNISEYSLSLSKKSLSMARGEVLPSLNLSYQRSWTKYENEDDYSNMELISLSASVPIFPLFNDFAGCRKAFNDVKQARYETLKTEDDIRLAIESSVMSLISAAKSVNSSKIALEFAEESFIQMEERFKHNMLSASDMLDAEIMYTSSRMNHTRSLYSFLRAKSSLMEVLGIENENKIWDASFF
ncbi:TolC family protein [bacterium]|nr:TolC family protein [bacterium]